MSASRNPIDVEISTLLRILSRRSSCLRILLSMQAAGWQVSWTTMVAYAICAGDCYMFRLQVLTQSEKTVGYFLLQT